MAIPKEHTLFLNRVDKMLHRDDIAVVLSCSAGPGPVGGLLAKKLYRRGISKQQSSEGEQGQEIPLTRYELFSVF